jgi:hypothetical protein
METMASRSVVVVLIVLASALSRCRADQVKTYFIGEGKLSTESGKPIGSQALLLEKIEDREKNLMIESAVVVDAKGVAEKRTMTLKVDGDHFALQDDTGSINGTGDLFGIPWQWTYWRGSFDAANGVHIQDENFIADPTIAVARKKITGKDGKVLMYMDVTMKSITPETYHILAGALFKK